MTSKVAIVTGASRGKRSAGAAPQRRLGQPPEIAELVAFLASEAAGWVNGQIIRANGGIA